ncbi:helix-turn-helix domain-containing protein [Nocardia miyunensis]|uniref:helix-turn-helix domain-containing protein n=1 Tax=Nocardia miyunensis TaxID=282684 RepID=UPI000835C2FA|nr:helix-turn-helix transcriptional regulator [Nocardia miyunensis]
MVARKSSSAGQSAGPPAGALASHAGQRLAAELGRVKQESGLSFAKLAAEIPYSRASLERYINGKLFPPRQAVHGIGRACRVDPEPLLELWDAASAAARPEARSTSPHRFSLPTRTRRLLVGGAAAVLVVGVLIFFCTSAFRDKSGTTKCRDYRVEARASEALAFTAVKLCWTSKSVRAQGELVAPPDSGPATAQLCLSAQKNVCAQIIDLAEAQPGRTRVYDVTVDLPPGYGAWVHTCVNGLVACSYWK